MALTPNQRLALCLLTGASAWVAGTPREAQACSVAFPCAASQSLPAHGERLPANLHGFLWRPPCKSDASSFDAQLKATAEDGSTQMLELTIEPANWAHSLKTLQYVHWNDTLAAGTLLSFSYREPNPGRLLYDPDPASAVRRTIELYVTPEADLPNEIGTLWSNTASGSFLLSSTDGDCGHELQASYVDLEFKANSATDPLVDALYFEVRVDGARWEPYSESYSSVNDGWLGGSALGKNRERVYLPCALPNHSPDQFAKLAEVLAPGRHTARMIGYLPDGTELGSAAYEFDLHCAYAQTDTTKDAAVPAEDRSAAPRTSARAAADSGGCSVLTPGAQPSALSIALFGLVVASRRRKLK